MDVISEPYQSPLAFVEISNYVASIHALCMDTELALMSGNYRIKKSSVSRVHSLSLTKNIELYCVDDVKHILFNELFIPGKLLY